MSYAALEVELRNGRVIPCHGEELPSSARALLVVLETEEAPVVDHAQKFSEALSRIRARQAARGHNPPSADAVAQQVLRERASWD